MHEPDRARQEWMADSVMRAGWVAVQVWLSLRISDTPEARTSWPRPRAQLALHVATAGPV